MFDRCYFKDDFKVKKYSKDPELNAKFVQIQKAVYNMLSCSQRNSERYVVLWQLYSCLICHQNENQVISDCGKYYMIAKAEIAYLLRYLNDEDMAIIEAWFEKLVCFDNQKIIENARKRLNGI